MNIAEILILVFVGVYALYVIIKKIRAIKKGTGGCCGCEVCNAACARDRAEQEAPSAKG